LQGLQDNILGVLKYATLKTLIDERLDLGFGDLNCHGGAASFLIMTLPTQSAGITS